MAIEYCGKGGADNVANRVDVDYEHLPAYAEHFHLYLLSLLSRIAYFGGRDNLKSGGSAKIILSYTHILEHHVPTFHQKKKTPFLVTRQNSPSPSTSQTIYAKTTQHAANPRYLARSLRARLRTSRGLLPLTRRSLLRLRDRLPAIPFPRLLLLLLLICHHHLASAPRGRNRPGLGRGNRLPHRPRIDPLRHALHPHGRRGPERARLRRDGGDGAPRRRREPGHGRGFRRGVPGGGAGGSGSAAAGPQRGRARLQPALRAHRRAPFAAAGGSPR